MSRFGPAVKRWAGKQRDLGSNPLLLFFLLEEGAGKRCSECVLDPQVSSEEIKSREVELGLKVGLLLRQLFSNSGSTDIVFVTLFRTAVGTVIAWYTSCCAMAKRALP